MTIILRDKGMNVGGQWYSPWSIITGLDPDKEAAMLAGGNAAPGPVDGPGNAASLAALTRPTVPASLVSITSLYAYNTGNSIARCRLKGLEARRTIVRNKSAVDLQIGTTSNANTSRLPPSVFQDILVGQQAVEFAGPDQLYVRPKVNVMTSMPLFEVEHIMKVL